MASFWDFLFGEKDKFKKLKTMSPEQQKVFTQFINLLGGGTPGAFGALSELLDMESPAYADFEAPYRQEFEQQTVPMLAERFAGAGAMGGGLSSSGFAQAMGGAGAGLQAQLAGLKSGLRQQAASNILNLLQGGLTMQPFAYGHRPSSPGLVPIMAGSFMQGLGGGARGGF